MFRHVGGRGCANRRHESLTSGSFLHSLIEPNGIKSNSVIEQLETDVACLSLYLNAFKNFRRLEQMEGGLSSSEESTIVTDDSGDGESDSAYHAISPHSEHCSEPTTSRPATSKPSIYKYLHRHRKHVTRRSNSNSPPPRYNYHKEIRAIQNRLACKDVCGSGD